MNSRMFHLAFPSHSLARTKKFFRALGCKFGRESKHSLIINLGGNQLVAQRIKELPPRQKGIYPRHFGLVFGSLKEWEQFLKRARRHRLKFYRSPTTRFAGKPLEHRSFFLEDPSRNLMEFKYYTHPEAVFGKKRYREVGDPR